MISFCIITDGMEPAKLLAQIDSIIRLNIPEYEIVISGNPQLSTPADLVVPMPHTAKQGRLGALRNAAAYVSSGDTIIMTDDDMLFWLDWYTAFQSFKGDWDVMACRILNPDGSRYWDWKAHKDGINWLLDYNDVSEWQSLTGGLTIMKRHVWERVQWNDELGFNQAEDVDFTNRIKAAGFKIVFNEAATITHDAPYTQMGMGVFKKE